MHFLALIVALLMSKSFLYFRALAVPAAGGALPADVGGSFFRCTAAEYRFQMSVDDGTWFDMQKGLSFRLLPGESFSKLSFRSLPTATAVNDIEFYYGSADVEDSRLSVLGDNESTVNVRSVETNTSSLNSGEASIANGGQLAFTGQAVYSTGFQNVTLRRRFLRITNMETAAGRVLDVGVGAVGTGYYAAVYPANTNFHRGNVEEFTMSGPIQFDNNSGAAIVVRFFEVFDLIF